MDIKPYLAAMTATGFCRTIPDNPKYKPVVIVDVSTFKFNRDAEYDTNNKLSKSGLAWWDGGMQSRVVDTVQIVCDEPNDLFVWFNAMNDERYPYFLGKLVNGHEFTERHKVIISQFFESNMPK